MQVMSPSNSASRVTLTSSHSIVRTLYEGHGVADDGKPFAADVEVRCYGGCIPAHSVILGAGSPVLKEHLWQTSQSETVTVIHMPDFHINDVLPVLTCFYTGKCSFHKNKLETVLKIFQDLGVSSEALDFDLANPEDIVTDGLIKARSIDAESYNIIYETCDRGDDKSADSCNTNPVNPSKTLLRSQATHTDPVVEVVTNNPTSIPNDEPVSPDNDVATTEEECALKNKKRQSTENENTVSSQMLKRQRIVAAVGKEYVFPSSKKTRRGRRQQKTKRKRASGAVKSGSDDEGVSPSWSEELSASASSESDELSEASLAEEAEDLKNFIVSDGVSSSDDEDFDRGKEPFARRKKANERRRRRTRKEEKLTESTSVKPSTFKALTHKLRKRTQKVIYSEDENEETSGRQQEVSSPDFVPDDDTDRDSYTQEENSEKLTRYDSDKTSRGVIVNEEHEDRDIGRSVSVSCQDVAVLLKRLPQSVVDECIRTTFVSASFLQAVPFINIEDKVVVNKMPVRKGWQSRPSPRCRKKGRGYTNKINNSKTAESVTKPQEISNYVLETTQALPVAPRRNTRSSGFTASAEIEGLPELHRPRNKKTCQIEAAGADPSFSATKSSNSSKESVRDISNTKNIPKNESDEETEQPRITIKPATELFESDHEEDPDSRASATVNQPTYQNLVADSPHHNSSQIQQINFRVPTQSATNDYPHVSHAGSWTQASSTQDSVLVTNRNASTVHHLPETWPPTVSSPSNNMTASHFNPPTLWNPSVPVAPLINIGPPISLFSPDSQGAVPAPPGANLNLLVTTNAVDSHFGINSQMNFSPPTNAFGQAESSSPENIVSVENGASFANQLRSLVQRSHSTPTPPHFVTPHSVSYQVQQQQPQQPLQAPVVDSVQRASNIAPGDMNPSSGGYSRVVGNTVIRGVPFKLYSRPDNMQPHPRAVMSVRREHILLSRHSNSAQNPVHPIVPQTNQQQFNPSPGVANSHIFPNTGVAVNPPQMYHQHHSGSTSYPQSGQLQQFQVNSPQNQGHIQVQRAPTFECRCHGCGQEFDTVHSLSSHICFART